jgi:hypothetical protein
MWKYIVDMASTSVTSLRLGEPPVIRAILFSILTICSFWLFANIISLTGGRGMTFPVSGFGLSLPPVVEQSQASVVDKAEVPAIPSSGGASADRSSIESLSSAMPRRLDVITVLLAFCGALGATLHALGSLVAFAGNGKFLSSWTLWYLAQPIRGGALAAGFFWLLQGGLLGGIGVGQTPVNGIAMMGATFLVGLFSDPAIEKLREVFQVLFRTAEKTRQDPLSATRKPVVTAIKIDNTVTPPVMMVTGSKFDPADQLVMNSVVATIGAGRTDKSLTATLAPVPPSGTVLRVLVVPTQPNAEPSAISETKMP